MPATLTYPGVYIEEVPSGVRTITGVATSIALFVGWAPRGPVDKAVRITSFADFTRQYGGLDHRSLLGYSVKHFYDNGGVDAYILRVAVGEATAGAAIDDLDVSASSPGDWANDYSVRLTRRTDDATRFGLDILHDLSNNAVVESFQDLSMSEGDPRFVESVVNDRSAYISVDAQSTTTPANATISLDNDTAGSVGTVTSPANSDFRSGMTPAFADGGIVDGIDVFNILCVPGLTDSSTISSLQTYCQGRRAFMIVDCDANETVSNAQTSALANITGSSAKNSAFYFPWVKAADSLRQGAVRDFPPCGFIAGIYARTDTSRGVWKAPAGVEASLNGSLGVSESMNDNENGQLNILGINCLRNFSGYGNVVWGARTLDGDNARGSEWKYIPVRRTALFIEESLYRGTKWVVFEPNDEPLWAQIRLNVGAFMHGLFRQGAFQGSSAKEAYLVKCDKETTTQNDINMGIVNILVGFAPLKPAEFVVIRIQQMAGQAGA